MTRRYYYRLELNQLLELIGIGRAIANSACYALKKDNILEVSALVLLFKVIFTSLLIWYADFTSMKNKLNHLILFAPLHCFFLQKTRTY